MITRILPLLLVVSNPALAQSIAPQDITPPATPEPAPAAPAPDQGLSVTVTDDSAWADLGIDIPSFATVANVPTPANAGGTAALGHAVAQVITADLKNNGLFKPVGPDALPAVPYEAVTAPAFADWAARGAEMLVQGSVSAGADGQL